MTDSLTSPVARHPRRIRRSLHKAPLSSSSSHFQLRLFGKNRCFSITIVLFFRVGRGKNQGKSELFFIDLLVRERGGGPRKAFLYMYYYYSADANLFRAFPPPDGAAERERNPGDRELWRWDAETRCNFVVNLSTLNLLFRSLLCFYHCSNL